MATTGQAPDELMPDPAPGPAAPAAPPAAPIAPIEVADDFLTTLLAGSASAEQFLTATCLSSAAELRTLSLPSLQTAARESVSALLHSLQLSSDSILEGPIISAAPVGSRGNMKLTLQFTVSTPALARSILDHCHAQSGLLGPHASLPVAARFLFQHASQDTALVRVYSPSHRHLKPAAILQLPSHCPPLQHCAFLWAGTYTTAGIHQRITASGASLAPLAPPSATHLRSGDTCALVAGIDLRSPITLPLSAGHGSLTLTLTRIPNRLRPAPPPAPPSAPPGPHTQPQPAPAAHQPPPAPAGPQRQPPPAPPAPPPPTAPPGPPA
ncbi:MAG: hypothetical protein ACK5PF_01060, partial [bacterium]